MNRSIKFLVAWLLAALSVGLGLQTSQGAAARPVPVGPFVVKPYVQLGDHADMHDPERMELDWETPPDGAAWTVRWRSRAEAPWSAEVAAEAHEVRVARVAPFEQWHATLDGLPPGRTVEYQCLREGVPVFAAPLRVRKTAAQSYRVAVFGDCGAATREQKKVAWQVSLAAPDFAMITGDVVYPYGRVRDYRAGYFPIYNAERASPRVGAPLIRTVPFLAAPGNHDIGFGHVRYTRDLNHFPDGLAYFLEFSEPLNGPYATVGARNTPLLIGGVPRRTAFLQAAGSRYPRMANYSFDYGNAHWTVLDGNNHADWRDPALRGWVRQDLAAAAGAQWRFVAVHEPPFHSSRTAAGEQRTRLLVDVFEAGRVDVVFAGHVHNYQRSMPLRFVPKRRRDGSMDYANNKLPGGFVLDRAFDGKINSRADGVIYLVTGAGGAKLHNAERQSEQDSWQKFTVRYVADIHSFTLVDVFGPQAVIRQVSEDGRDLDQFILTH